MAGALTEQQLKWKAKNRAAAKWHAARWLPGHRPMMLCEYCGGYTVGGRRPPRAFYVDVGRLTASSASRSSSQIAADVFSYLHVGCWNRLRALVARMEIADSNRIFINRAKEVIRNERKDQDNRRTANLPG